MPDKGKQVVSIDDLADADLKAKVRVSFLDVECEVHQDGSSVKEILTEVRRLTIAVAVLVVVLLVGLALLFP